MSAGAIAAHWRHWARILQPDLLPAVTVQADIPVSRGSQLVLDGKVPSEIRNGKAGGFLDFTNPVRVTTAISDGWLDGKHNVGMLCRTLRVIDVDVDDRELSDAIYSLILNTLAPDDESFTLPIRDRANSGKFALLYRLEDAPTVLGKGVVNLRDHKGAVEFLGNKQFFVLDGLHKTGAHYQWPDGRPASVNAVPLLRMEQLLQLYSVLQDAFSEVSQYKPWRYDAKAITKVGTDFAALADDPAVKFLEEHNLVIGGRSDGALYVTCPWCDASKATSPIKHGDAMFIPKGVNHVGTYGYRCVHTHHAEMTASDYLEHIGYRQLEIAAEFPIVTSSSDIAPPAADTRPAFTTKKDGTILPTLPNVVAMMRWTAGFGYVIRYDKFKDIIVYRHSDSAEWRVFTDESYTELRLRAILAGVDATLSADITRTAVNFVAHENTVDTATEWLSAQRWDGVPRVASFWSTVMRQKQSPYLEAVSQYLWTALAGRVLRPGCQVDMVPVLSGAQGQRKSTLVALLTPSASEYVSVSLSDRDADLARSLRGKLVADWAELRGIRTREADAIKGWLTQNKDEWVPKFKEFSSTMPRRFVVIGTTNNTRYLSDPSGSRRWLPLQVPTGTMLHTQYLSHNREQLWAEGAELFKQHGVMWEAAESLARQHHGRATVRDVWQPAVERWLRESPRKEIEVSDALAMACGVPTSAMSLMAQQRMAAVLAAIGWEETQEGYWVKKKELDISIYV